MNGLFSFPSKRVIFSFQYIACIIFVHPLSVSAEVITNYYDSQQRLTGTTHDSGIYIGYTYDNVGNRLTETISATPQNAPASIALLNGVAADTSNSNPVGAPSYGSASRDLARLRNPSLKNSTQKGAAAGTPEADIDKDSIAATVLYEDAEDGKTIRWAIDDGPSGATIQNIHDSDSGNQVIKLSGDGLLNGYLLLKDDGSYWYDTDHSVIQWNMKYSEEFVVSVAVQTTNGPRYLSFTPEQDDALGKDTDIFYGLGTRSKDGKWHTYTIDLDYKLHEAQPDTKLVSVLGFYINGSGFVDNIQTLKEIPVDLDSNGNGVTDINEIKAGTNPYRVR